MDKLLHLTIDFFDNLLRLPTRLVEDRESAQKDFALEVLPDFMPHDAFIQQEWELWDDMQERIVYLLGGPLQLRLLCMRLRREKAFFTAGPFLTKVADEAYCNEILRWAQLPASLLVPLKLYYGSVPVVDSSAAVSAAELFVRNYYGLKTDVPVKPVSQLLQEKHMLFPPPQKEEARLQNIEHRFELELVFSQWVQAGDTAAAVDTYKKIAESAESILSMSNPLRSKKNRLVVLNTMLSIAARGTAVHPFYLDAVFWDYAYQVEQETQMAALFPLGEKMVEEYCDTVRRFARQGLAGPVRKVVDYIGTHLSDKLALDDLARVAKVSPNHLSALFKKETGQTVTAYINGQRAEEMARLLLTTNIPVGEISAHVGFQDANYASRVFKAVKGLAPTAFRIAGGGAWSGA